MAFLESDHPVTLYDCRTIVHLPSSMRKLSRYMQSAKPKPIFELTTFTHAAKGISDPKEQGILMDQEVFIASPTWPCRLIASQSKICKEGLRQKLS